MTEAIEYAVMGLLALAGVLLTTVVTLLGVPSGYLILEDLRKLRSRFGGSEAHTDPGSEGVGCVELCPHQLVDRLVVATHLEEGDARNPAAQ